MNLHDRSDNRDYRDDGLFYVNANIDRVKKVHSQYTPNKNLGGYADAIFKTLGLANKYSHQNHVYNMLYYYSQLSYANFNIRMKVGETIKFMVADKEIEAIGEFDNSEIGAQYVVSGLCASMILRNKNFTEFYATIPVSFTEKNNQEDILSETYMFFHQLLAKNEGDKNMALATMQHIKEFLDWNEYKKYIKIQGYHSEEVWKGTFILRKDIYNLQKLPVLEIYHYILNEDQTNFEKSVKRALKAWQKYFTMPIFTMDEQEFDHSLSPEGYLALEIASACAFAHDRGMKLKTVESDYIPKWMIEGRFEGFELLVKDEEA